MKKLAVYIVSVLLMLMSLCISTVTVQAGHSNSDVPDILLDANLGP